MKESFVGILADRRESPQDDMVSILARAEVNGVKMSDEQIYGFMRNLLPAGAETTSRSTASLAMGLLTHPDQLDAGARTAICFLRRSKREFVGRHRC